jgi:hypothetical protein
VGCTETLKTNHTSCKSNHSPFICFFLILYVHRTKCISWTIGLEFFLDNGVIYKDTVCNILETCTITELLSNVIQNSTMSHEKSSEQGSLLLHALRNSINDLFVYLIIENIPVKVFMFFLNYKLILFIGK